MFLLPSPIEQISHPLLEEKNIKLWLKRDDLIHSTISGNKWRKLSFFFSEAKRLQLTSIASFGGAWSNHIYSLAAAGAHLGFQTIGIIRGEEPEKYSTALEFALKQGMELHFVSREAYRDKQQLELDFKTIYPKTLFIPEGGAHELGTIGCEKIIEEIKNFTPDYIALACGTATTMMGVAKTAKQSEVLGFSALKNGDFLLNDWKEFMQKNQINNVKIINDFSGGGYAKSYLELEDFIVDFYRSYKIILDPIYTGKMMFGVFELLKKGFFKEGANIVAIHTGGLQGLNGFPFLQERLKNA